MWSRHSRSVLLIPSRCATAWLYITPWPLASRIAVLSAVIVSAVSGDSPGAPSAAFALPATTEFGHPRVLLTKQLRGDWVQVYLPLRPNGQLGWVRSRDVALTPIVDEVDVDLARSTLTWTRAGQVVLSVASAVGAPSTPTPRGTFFVTDVLPQSNPSGAYGAWIIALDAHSEALATFEGGDPRIAIHGTNDPSSIGHAVSNGCMRVDAGPLDALRAALLPGTPVVVH